ncbi:hypothetical protein REPUB_Repub13aG0276000 [Reevesia pubescens]
MFIFCSELSVKNLELKDYIPLPAPTKVNERLRSKYDLIANIVMTASLMRGSIGSLYNGSWKKYGMRCKICMFLKHYLKWLRYLKLICRYRSSNSRIENLI